MKTCSVLVGMIFACTLAGCAELTAIPEKIVVPINATIHIVTTPAQMPCPSEGCYTFTPWQSHEIYMLATKHKGKFFVNQQTLGHELTHVLNHLDPSRFPNPDTTFWQRRLADDLSATDLDGR